jgi:hypothetical protein
MRDFPDVWRQLHPDATDCYTVWEVRTVWEVGQNRTVWEKVTRGHKEMGDGNKKGSARVGWSGLLLGPGCTTYSIITCMVLTSSYSIIICMVLISSYSIIWMWTAVALVDATVIHAIPCSCDTTNNSMILSGASGHYYHGGLGL